MQIMGFSVLYVDFGSTVKLVVLWGPNYVRICSAL